MNVRINQTRLVKPVRSHRLRVISILRPRTGQRRVWDRVRLLERDLAHAQQLNVDLTALLSDLTRENWKLRYQADASRVEIANLTTELAVAYGAGRANLHPVSFSFVERGFLTPEDTATQPMPRLMPDEVSRRRVPRWAIPRSMMTPRIIIGRSPMAGLSPTHVVQRVG